jgi:hypothetical protein
MQRVFLVLLIFGFTFNVFSQKTPRDRAVLEKIAPLPLRFPTPPKTELPKLVIKLYTPKVRYWKNQNTLGININQAAFSDNWRSGGVTSVAFGAQGNLKFDYTKNDKNYVNELILRYGKLKNKDQMQRTTHDRIYWDNKIGLKLSKHWSFFGSINFESQFDRGYSFKKDKSGEEVATLISRFMAPGYLTESLGFEYKTGKSFWLRIGTGTARQTIVLDKNLYLTNPKNFGVVPGKTFRNELAFQVVTNFEKEVATNILLKSRHSLFANYERLKNIDQRLDLAVQAKVNKLVNVTVAGVGVYDDDASDRIQASQTLSLGLLFKLPY